MSHIPICGRESRAVAINRTARERIKVLMRSEMLRDRDAYNREGQEGVVRK